MPLGELVGTTLKLTTGQEVTDGHSHTPTVTTTEVSPDLGEFAEMQGDVSVEMIPLCYH
jgi:hypothetical protein